MAKEVEYVKTNKNKYLLQIEGDIYAKESRWGFYLTDGESCWDGGFGCGLGGEWEVIEFGDIPKSFTNIRRKLKEAKRAIKDDAYEVNLQHYSFAINEEYKRCI